MTPSEHKFKCLVALEGSQSVQSAIDCGFIPLTDSNEILGLLSRCGHSGVVGWTITTLKSTLDECFKDVLTIPMRSIRVPQKRIKSYSEADITSLADDLQHRGQINPIVVRELNNHRYLIVDGIRRYQAACSLGWPALDCRLVTREEEVGSFDMMTKSELFQGLAEVHEGPWSPCPICKKPMNRKGHPDCKITDVFNTEGFTAHELANILLQMPDKVVAVSSGYGDIIRITSTEDSVTFEGGEHDDTLGEDQ